jgi:hypothetical protein
MREAPVLQATEKASRRGPASDYRPSTVVRHGYTEPQKPFSYKVAYKRTHVKFASSKKSPGRSQFLRLRPISVILHMNLLPRLSVAHEGVRKYHGKETVCGSPWHTT